MTLSLTLRVSMVNTSIIGVILLRLLSSFLCKFPFPRMALLPGQKYTQYLEYEWESSRFMTFTLTSQTAAAKALVS